MANVSILESSLKLIPQCNHWLFFWIILIISVVALIGNSLAIISIVTRKQKYLQKVCTISLALADIFSIVMFATNNLDALSRELKVWKLGEFLCHFIPMGQVLGTTASSIVLLVIAVDRYQNVTTAIASKRWNPSLWKCTVTAFLLLIFCTVTSYPMYVFFTFNPIQVVHTNGTHYSFEDAFLCAAIEKDKLKLYYIIVAVLIFLPSIVVFIWFYYQIAAMVWRHRKPVSAKYQDTKIDISVSSFSTPKLSPKRTKTAQVQRKIRTFKVIIVLMVSFTVCRLPYWIFFVVKLVEIINGATMWYFNLALTALNMLNCALNPLLYAFLNQTIDSTKKFQDLVCALASMCCCCFTSKYFDKLHKDNTFGMKFRKKNERIEDVKKDNSPRIKFVDPQVPMYP